jgi:hypothetical protein
MSFDTPESVVAELVSFTENDGDIYRQTTSPILKNLATKKAQGKYRADLAVQAFMYLAEAGARKYAKEYGGRGAVWHEMFPIDIRRRAATHWRDEFETEFNLGNYNNLLPLKYQQPSPEQARALVDFAGSEGRWRGWKLALSNCWQQAIYPGMSTKNAALLQQVRNQLGPSWLDKVSLTTLRKIARL